MVFSTNHSSLTTGEKVGGNDDPLQTIYGPNHTILIYAVIPYDSIQ